MTKIERLESSKDTWTMQDIWDDCSVMRDKINELVDKVNELDAQVTYLTTQGFTNKQGGIEAKFYEFALTDKEVLKEYKDRFPNAKNVISVTILFVFGLIWRWLFLFCMYS